VSARTRLSPNINPAVEFPVVVDSPIPQLVKAAEFRFIKATALRSQSPDVNDMDVKSPKLALLGNAVGPAKVEVDSPILPRGALSFVVVPNTIKLPNVPVEALKILAVNVLDTVKLLIVTGPLKVNELESTSPSMLVACVLAGKITLRIERIEKMDIQTILFIRFLNGSYRTLRAPILP